MFSRAGDVERVTGIEPVFPAWEAYSRVPWRTWTSANILGRLRMPDDRGHPAVVGEAKWRLRLPASASCCRRWSLELASRNRWWPPRLSTRGPEPATAGERGTGRSPCSPPRGPACAQARCTRWRWAGTSNRAFPASAGPGQRQRGQNPGLRGRPPPLFVRLVPDRREASVQPVTADRPHDAGGAATGAT